MSDAPEFDSGKIFQIARAFGDWKPMCEVVIITDENNLERAIERFFILRSGSVECRLVGSATEALFEAAVLNQGTRRDRSPIVRRYKVQFAAGKDGFKPFITVVIEYDDQGQEKAHIYQFYVLAPNGDTYTANGYRDAVTMCEQLSDAIRNRHSSDGTPQPVPEDNVGHKNQQARNRRVP